MTSLAALADAHIAPSDGHLSGYVDGSGRAWRFVVQIAKSPSNLVLGTMRLGDPLTSKQWVDITSDCHGVTLTRGAAAGGRWGAGQFSFRLNNATGAYHPHQSSYYGPGTLVRVVHAPPVWQVGDTQGNGALITGLTISWNESSDAEGRTKWVDVTALETISLLNGIDNPAQPLQGAGESPTGRLYRILDAAGWPFNRQINFPIFPPNMQGTTLASNALAEVYRTVDSQAAVAFSQRDGRFAARLLGGNQVAGVDEVGADIPIPSDSIITANDDTRLIGQIAVARAGGTAVVYTNPGIAGRYQQRSTQRLDLNTQNPGSDQDLAAFANNALGKGRQTYRVLRFKIDTNHGPKVWEYLKVLELGRILNIARPETPTTGTFFAGYIVSGYTLNITRQRAGVVQISGTIETDVLGTSTAWTRYSSRWDEAQWGQALWT